jgi:hypothetical protein
MREFNIHLIFLCQLNIYNFYILSTQRKEVKTLV